MPRRQARGHKLKADGSKLTAYMSIKDKTQSLASACNGGGNFIVSLTFLLLVQATGQSMTFWIYGVFCVASFVFTYTLVPETKGKGVEELAENHSAGKKAWDTRAEQTQA